MADINIEKKGKSILPWIVGGLVIAALLWFLLGRDKNDAVDATSADTTTTPMLSPDTAGTGGTPLGTIPGDTGTIRR